MRAAGGEAKRAGAWASAGALAALAAVALAAAAAAAAAGGGGPGEEALEEGGSALEGAAGQPAGAAQEGGGQVRQEPDVVMPSKSSRPGCEEDDACYVPPAVAVAAGGSVTWRNDDVAFHTVTSGEYGSPDGMFDSGHMDPGEEFTVSFKGAGGSAVEYHCTLHPWMKGVVNVERARAE